MDTEDVPAFLSKRVPALAFVINEAVVYLKTRYGADTPMSDHVLGVVLAPLASRMLRSNDQNDRSTLYSLFAALDELLDDPNPNMADVVFVSFLEQLAQDRQGWELAQAYMGERLVRSFETEEDVLLKKRSHEVEAAELILAFVRGERSWKTLEKAGVYIEFRSDGYEIDNPWKLTATASPRDVALGILVYYRSSEQLQRWAGIILAGSSFLDLSDEFETTPEGDILLNALWDATFGDEINQEALRVAEGLVGPRRSL